jgi:hypothetical protein
MKTDAEKLIRQAMIEHGTPNWVAHVPISVRKLVPVSRIAELREELARSRKRHDPLSALVEWAAERHGQTATTAEIAEAVGVSNSTALNVIDKRPDVFIKKARGRYELRDAAEDRAQARNNKEE